MSADVEKNGKNNESNEPKTRSNFIKDIINEDNKTGKFDNRVVTRFPPEPNGYLHIGHAKSICLNFGLANEYNGKCHLRFDDTNPTKEEDEYVDSIKEDVKWLGFDWGENLYYASGYFDQLYEYAIKLIKKGKAYVCDLTSDEIREYRGTLKTPGKESPYRNRGIEENLNLFEQIKNGQFPDGTKVLRAKVDMASGNINMRDPVIYRILHSHHHRTGDKWCIYPMYDFTHGQSDSIEKITHSICTLEFEIHRPLYDWFVEELEIYHPQQIEFARLNLTYTVMSKRKLLQLVKEHHVNGWDDPRMPTIAGLRRRGYTASAIRDFAEKIGVAKADSIVDIAFLEYCLREDLNKTAVRMMAVIKPIKLIIENYPQDQEEELLVDNNPESPTPSTRKVKFTRELYIEEDDFREDPPKKFFRLFPGSEVRLKNAYIIKCESFEKDDDGSIKLIRCSYDPTSKSGNDVSGKKVKGTLHWVSAVYGKKAELRIYDRLFTKENPDDVEEGKSFLDNINPNSLEIIKSSIVEPALLESNAGDIFQFLRHGYFCKDKDSAKNSTEDLPVFNKTVGLKDSWAKIEQKA
jgi:glutaminyl-tRNA synthetase